MNNYEKILTCFVKTGQSHPVVDILIELPQLNSHYLIPLQSLQHLGKDKSDQLLQLQ